MDDSESVVGLTLAELGFLMLFVVLLLSVVGRASHPEPEGPSSEEYEALRVQLDSVRTQLADAQDEIAVLRALIEEMSNQRRTCREAGIIDGHLLSIVVLGDNSYRMLPQGSVVDIQELQAAYAPQLTEAQNSPCNHTIDVQYDRNLSSGELVGGMNRLQRIFYPTQPRPFQ